MSKTSQECEGFTGVAVTRSLLGWGAVAGPFYLLLGLGLALTRDGFDLSRHPLSVLTLGDYGWIQRLNFLLSGLMTIAAAVGFTRAMRGSHRSRWAGRLVGAYGACLVASGIFRPDPMTGFPPGSRGGETSVSGVLHLVFGSVGFLCLVVACFVVAAWSRRAEESAWTRYSRISGAGVAVTFYGGAALSGLPTSTPGVVALWIAVLAAWAWLAATSVHLYRTVPDPGVQRDLIPAFSGT